MRGKQRAWRIKQGLDNNVKIRKLKHGVFKNCIFVFLFWYIQLKKHLPSQWLVNVRYKSLLSELVHVIVQFLLFTRDQEDRGQEKENGEAYARMCYGSKATLKELGNIFLFWAERKGRVEVWKRSVLFPIVSTVEKVSTETVETVSRLKFKFRGGWERRWCNEVSVCSQWRVQLHLKDHSKMLYIAILKSVKLTFNWFPFSKILYRQSS